MLSGDERHQLGGSKLLRSSSLLLHGVEDLEGFVPAAAQGGEMHSLCLEGPWLKGMQLRSAWELRAGCLGRGSHSKAGEGPSACASSHTCWSL